MKKLILILAILFVTVGCESADDKLQDAEIKAESYAIRVCRGKGFDTEAQFNKCVDREFENAFDEFMSR